MNSRELILNAINGKPHDRVPVAQHNFTFCLKHYGITMKQYRENPLLAAKALANTCYDFGYDCIIIDFDTCTLAEAMGSKLGFPDHEPARVNEYFIQSIDDFEKLRVPDPNKDGRLPLWLETTRELRKLVGNEKAIMARADQGPFGLLFQLRRSEEMMLDLLMDYDDLIYHALDVCTQAGAAFAKAQIEAGADLTSIGDSASGESLIAPEMYLKFAQPYQKKYKEILGDGKISLHICGMTNNIIEGMVNTGFEVLELDHLNNIEKSLQMVNGRASVWGNLDPSSVISHGTHELVMSEAKKVIDAAMKYARNRFVLCPGCLVNSDAPPENIQAMTDAASLYGTYLLNQ
jgi:uroporphyrinogen decarboxylase